MIYRIILLLSIFVIFSCTKQSSIFNEKVVDVKGKSESIIDASKFIDSVKYIKLENTLDMPIGRISEILFGDNLILVIDGINQAVYMFDEKGNYLRRISSRGRGPGEYLTISRVMLDRSKGIIMIYDINKRQLLKYDLDGQFIGTIEEFGGKDKIARDIINLKTGGFLCYKPDKSTKKINEGLWLVNDGGEFIKYIYEIKDICPLSLPQNQSFLYNVENGIGFIDLITNSIYEYNGNKLTRTLTYNFTGKNFLDYKGKSSIPRGESINIILFNVQSSSYIITEWLDNDDKYSIVVYSKKDKSFEEGLTISNVVNAQTLLRGTSVRNNEAGIWTCILEPYSLFLNVTAGAPPAIKEVSENLLGNVSEQEIYQMNPIIEIMYLKN